MPNPADMDKKLAWLMARIKSDVDAEVLRAFAAINAEEVSSIRTGWPKWHGGQSIRPNTAFNKWFDRAQLTDTANSLGFQGGFSQFVSFEFDDWLSKFSDEVRASVKRDDFDQFLASVQNGFEKAPKAAKIRGSLSIANDPPSPSGKDDDHIIVFVDPDHHSVENYEQWNRDRMVDQRLMYLSPHSVQHWRRVTKDHSYETFTRCYDTLIETLKHDAILGMDYPIILGAGAPAKEKRIFECASKGKGTQDAAYFDASFFMLMNSFREIGTSIRRKFEFDVYCMDFLSTILWDRGVELKEKRATFFLLGETVGNLHEPDFFQSLTKIMRSGDRIVIGAEFFDSKREILDHAEELKERYRSPSVIDLVLGCLNDSASPTLEGLSPTAKRSLVDVGFEASNELKKVALSSTVKDAYSVFFFTTQDIDMDAVTLKSGLNLGTSKRYVIGNFVKRITAACKLKHVDTVSHPGGARYSHIIFEKQ